MRLVLHDGVGRQVEDSTQRVSDAGCGRLVTGRFVPDGDDVLLTSKKHKETARVSAVRSRSYVQRLRVS